MQDKTIVIIHLKNKIKLQKKKRIIYMNKWSRRIIERPECKSCRFSCCFWMHIQYTHIYSLFSVAFFYSQFFAADIFAVLIISYEISNAMGMKERCPFIYVCVFHMYILYCSILTSYKMNNIDLKSIIL